MNFKSPLFIFLVIVILLSIAGSIFTKDYIRMASMLVLGASLIVLIKLTIGKNTPAAQGNDLPPTDVTSV